MSNFTQFRSNEEELTSPSSDEKMDTGSESFRSQDTPNSIRSSDFEDNPEQSVLRLQNPENDLEDVLKTPDVFKNFQNPVREAKTSDNQRNPGQRIPENLTSDLRNPDAPIRALDDLRTPDVFKANDLKNSDVLRLSNPDDSLVNKISSLKIDSPKDVRPKNLGISPPRFSSTLTLTTNHPLMGLSSPDDYPDVIPKKHKVEDEKDLSFSSIEDERPNETNGLYSPEKNTSKNNLYFTENFVTAESHILSDTLDLPPDVARVERRKIIPKFELTPHRVLSRNLDANRSDSAVKLGHSTPKCPQSDVTAEEFHSGVADWCDSPSQLRAMPNFDLPIEMSSAIGMHNDLESPDVISSSTSEKSAFQALLDPYTGSVALAQTVPKVQHHQRRKIQLPPEDDRCSVDSISASSIESEEEPPEPEPVPERPRHDNEDVRAMSDDETTRSKSTNTISYSSEPIPEYSLCEELSNERGWVSVHSHACDVKVIEPYKRVLSHGGYSAAGAALIVFSACHLPDNARHDYTYVMDNLFLYVIWSLERLVTDEYILVYLHGSAGRRRLPAFHWLHECYKLIDRRLRKSLKQLYLVHPTFWLKSFVLITKPFVSSKFFKKLSYVKNLDELMEKVPVDPNAIPEIVKQYDANKRR